MIKIQLHLYDKPRVETNATLLLSHYMQLSTNYSRNKSLFMTIILYYVKESPFNFTILKIDPLLGTFRKMLGIPEIKSLDIIFILTKK